MLKVVLLGEARVGKTSIRKAYMGEGFKENHVMTIGADFALKKISISQKNIEYNIGLQIWDIGGQKGFEKIRKRFLYNPACIIIVFDLTDVVSMQKLQLWLEEAWMVNNRKNYPILIIGNKSDLEIDRKVSKESVDKYLTNLQKELEDDVFVNYIETSALTGKNIEKAFIMITNVIIEQLASV